MRVYVVSYYLQMGRWPGTWFTTTASPLHSKRQPISQASSVNAASIHFITPRLPALLGAMEPIPLIHRVLPLNYCCSQVVSEPCLRTSTGKRCYLQCDHQLSEGFQVSSGPFCYYSGFTFVCSRPPVFLRPARLTMPRLRPRMTARRGSSRGLVMRQPVSPSSSSPSDFSDPEAGRNVVYRRGRGRGRGAQIRLSSNVHSHSARFIYPCSLNHHEFIAEVSITLRPNPVAQSLLSGHNSNAQALPSEIVPAPEDEVLFCPPDVSRPSAPDDIASQLASQMAKPNAPSGSGFSNKVPLPPDDEDFNPYACPVEEEAPSPNEA